MAVVPPSSYDLRPWPSVFFSPSRFKDVRFEILDLGAAPLPSCGAPLVPGAVFGRVLPLPASCDTPPNALSGLSSLSR